MAEETIDIREATKALNAVFRRIAHLETTLQGVVTALFRPEGDKRTDIERIDQAIRLLLQHFGTTNYETGTITLEAAPSETEKNKATRLDLIAEVYIRVAAATESFEPDSIGEELAYLFGAIGIGTSAMLTKTSVLHNLLKSNFAPGHPVWEYVFPDDDKDTP